FFFSFLQSFHHLPPLHPFPTRRSSDLNPLSAYIQAKPAKKAHVLVGHPHQGETGNQVSAPIIKQKFVARHNQKEDGYVVAEAIRSEEHTSELQSPCNLVCRLLLEKKKK